MPQGTHSPEGPWAPVGEEMNGWMHVETSPLVPYGNPLEQGSPLLPHSVFNNSNNNFGNAVYLLNAFLQGAQLVTSSLPEGGEEPRR